MNNKSLALTCIAHLMSIQSFLVYVSVFCAKPNRELTDAFATKQHEIVLIVRFHSFLLLFRVSLKTKIQLACPHTTVILTHAHSLKLSLVSRSHSLYLQYSIEILQIISKICLQSPGLKGKKQEVSFLLLIGGRRRRPIFDLIKLVTESFVCVCAI